MTQNDTKVRELAEQLSAALTTSTRDNGDKFVHLKDESPRWMTEVIHAAHGDAMPDDHIYRFIEKAADAIAEADEDADLQDAISEIETDIYTADLMRWFAGNYEYCDQAIEEGLWESGGKTGYGAQSTSVTDLLAIGQSLHIREVGTALLDALAEYADTLEEE